MGACASRPKDLKKGAPPPSESEAPITPKKPADPPLQDDETTNKQELIEPLVDVSEVPAAPEANTKSFCFTIFSIHFDLNEAVVGVGELLRWFLTIEEKGYKKLSMRDHKMSCNNDMIKCRPKLPLGWE
nr:phosphatidylinositol transfer protein sfh5-like [Ipomoea batatas]